MSGIFYALHDELQVEIDDRFRDFTKIVAMFPALDPKNYQREVSAD